MNQETIRIHPSWGNDKWSDPDSGTPVAAATPCSASWIKITADPKTWPTPKTAVLVLVRDDTRMVTGYIEDLGEGEGVQWWECEKVNLKNGTWDDTYDTTLWPPTHWMPLPSLPNSFINRPVALADEKRPNQNQETI